MTFAKQNLAHKPGVVLDYLTLSSSTNSFAFQGDTTYLITGTFTVSGSATFEGGTVVKFDESSGGLLDLEGQWSFKTGPYHIAVFTSKNDNSVGETISGSTGSPTVSTIQYIYGDATSGNLLKYATIRYAGLGIYANFDEQAGGGIWDCQFLHCGVAVEAEDYSDAYLRNVLFSKCGTAVAEATIPEDPGVLKGDNITADRIVTFYDASSQYWLSHKQHTNNCN